MQAQRIITLLTDFGLKDGYVASMKGVILSIAPDITLIDVTHDIAPQAIGEGSFLLQSVARHYPLGTVHLAVVDPGVGTDRRAIAIKTPQGFYIGPDNGLLAPVVQDVEASQRGMVEIIELTERQYWRSEISSTFHGRDIFAPVAAHLANGVPFLDLGRPVCEIVPSVLQEPAIERTGMIAGAIIHVDRFGNCVTNITREHLALTVRDDMELVVELAGQQVPGLYRTYSAGPVGVPMALIGSSGHLEIAVANGNASQWFGVTAGDRVRVHEVSRHSR